MERGFMDLTLIQTAPHWEMMSTSRRAFLFALKRFYEWSKEKTRR